MKSPINHAKKEYLKPEWSKEKLFERFSMACRYKTCGTPLHTPVIRS